MIRLTHIGEVLVASMLQSLSDSDRLSMVTDVGDKEAGSLATALAAAGITNPQFLADEAQLKVELASGRVASCDGAQTVDVLAAGTSSAVALELKLGLDRMTRSAFAKRFCEPGSFSKHSRVQGSMVAVLSRSFDGDEITTVRATRDRTQSWRLEREWWLVVRRAVWRGWAGQLPTGVRWARVLVFEELVEHFGGEVEFNRLVGSLCPANAYHD